MSPIPCASGKHEFANGDGDCTRCGLAWDDEIVEVDGVRMTRSLAGMVEVVELTPLAAHPTVLNWIIAERVGHADVKYDEAGSAHAIIRQAIIDDDMLTLLNFPYNYLKRVELMGVTTPAGQQALGKAAVTLIAYLELVVETYGDLPAPGYPSGELH